MAELAEPGVVTGEALLQLLRAAKARGFAIPAVNCVCSSSINAVLEAARDARAPVMIQLTNGGSAFYAGKGMKNTSEQAAVVGAVSAALHVRTVAQAYGVPVVLCSDHCARKLLPWLDGLIEADEDYFAAHGVPLFSAHTLDLSEEPLEANLELSASYLRRLSAVRCLLEVELGASGKARAAAGGEADSGAGSPPPTDASAYTQPDEIRRAYDTLRAVSPLFLLAPAFGNAHGSYQPRGAVLRPSILCEGQRAVSGAHGAADGGQRAHADASPVLYAFHGGSGASAADVRAAIASGVVKMNVDTDTQWAYWNGLKEYEAQKRPYLQAQAGNPEGEGNSNKRYYDTRVWMRRAELGMVERVKIAIDELGATGVLSGSSGVVAES